MDKHKGMYVIEQRLVDKARQALIPITTGFELTPYCNFRCDMCYVRKEFNSAQETSRLKPLEFWKEKALQFKAMGGYFITLTGGEPLLYPHFKELYTFLCHQGFVIRVNTNGYLITEEIAELFATYKPRRLNITAYGASNETYKNLCHIDKGYDRFIHAIRLLQEKGVNICLNLTPVKKNQEDLHTLMKWAEKEGIQVQIAHYVALPNRDYVEGGKIIEVRNSPKQAAANDLLYKKYKDGEEIFIKWAKEIKEYLQTPYFPEIEGCSLDCNAAKCSCWINWKGELQPCVDLMEPKVDLSTMTFSEAWEKLKNACNNLPVQTDCKNCKLHPLCNICYARIVNEKRNCGNIDYICQTTKCKADLLMNNALAF